MGDLYLAIAISLILSAAICVASLHVGKLLSRPVATFVVLFVTGLLFYYAIYLIDDLRVTRMIPWSGALILGNFTPAAVAMIVGFGWRLVPGGKLRKGIVLMPLVGVCLVKAYSPAWAADDVPVLGDRWEHRICRQTSKESCSPAAAATLLTAHGIQTTEQEMARLCLTSKRGTSMLGLYRGLKLKTAGTPYDIEVFHGSVAQLRGLGGAMLVSVGLKKELALSADPRYKDEWGWPPGLKHTVVVFDFPGQEVEIGDPAVGRERWSVKDLETLWYSEGLRLISRP